MARPYPWKCRECGERTLSPIVVDYPTEMEYDGRSYAFTVPDLEVLQCEACRARVLPDPSYHRIIDTLRTYAGLLKPVEIREKRKQLGLTQEQLASRLDIAEETVFRWETGAQIQPRGFDILLRLFFDLSTVRDYLSTGKIRAIDRPLLEEKQPVLS